MAALGLDFYSKLFENSSTTFVVTANTLGEPIEASSAHFLSKLGFPEQTSTQPKILLHDLIHEDDLGAYQSQSKAIQSSLETQQFTPSNYRLKHKSGLIIWVKDTVQVVHNGDHEPQYIHLMTDITAEVSVHEQVVAKEQRLKSLIQNAGIGLWEWKTNEDFFTCDDNWSFLIGFEKAVTKMKLTRFYALIHQESIAQFKREIEALKAGKLLSTKCIIRIRHLSGKWRYHECFLNHVKDCAGSTSIISVSHSDITQQKENELAAIAALATRNQFFARVSHEIRTPLHGILGMLGIVKKQIKDESAREKIDKIVGSSEYLLFLLNDILDLAKLNETMLKVSVELTSISEVIKQVERLFMFKADQKSISFVTELPSAQHDMVNTDKVRITQILSNLVSNAIKYTHRGEVKIYTKLENENLVLCIQDTGIGIKNINNVFDAYHQEQGGIEQSFASTGLGLEIVKKLCDLLGIQIILASDVSGTLFELVLGKPMPNTIFAKKPEREEIIDTGGIENLKVLVVDDNDINREIVIEMLKQCGVDCKDAVDGYEAVKSVNNDNNFDLVLMDKHMPNMNGIDATKQIRANTSLQKQPKIIALTADAFDIDNQAWFEIGLDEIITKPFEMTILIKTIKRSLRS